MAQNETFDELEKFLKAIPPFTLLPEKTLRELVPSLQVQSYSPNEIILCPEGPPTRFLYLIRSGGVNFTTPGGEDGKVQVVDLRGEKEFFGVFSLWSNRPSPFTIVATQKTICCLLTKEVFTRLLNEHSNFLLYFTMGPSKGFKAVAKIEGPEQQLSFSGSETDSLLFLIRVRDIMRSRVVTCRKEFTIVEAAQLMTQKRVGSVIVQDQAENPIGIMTDGDMRHKVIAAGKKTDIPVGDIMSSPLFSVTSEAFYFDALITMIRNRIKYLPVIDAGKIVGIVSERDLIVSQGNNPSAIIRRIYHAPDIDMLIQIRKDIHRTLKVLMNRGWRAKETFELITLLNDHVTIRLIQLAEDTLERQGAGKPPIPYAWMALGSEGRREQTLCTDQDNALIFAGAEGTCEPEVQSYFLSLAKLIVSGLERCGFPLCTGEIMASNPQWCQPLGSWKKYYRKWILETGLSNQEILISSLFFDFRALYGAATLVDELRKSIESLLPQCKIFLRNLAKGAMELQTPLSLFNRLVVEKSGIHKNKLDIKLYGLMPLIDSVRVLALEQCVFKTNTLERIDALIEKEVFSVAEGNELREAFSLMMLLRLQNHLSQMNQGLPLNNFINPDELSLIQKSVLKAAFKSIDQLQRRIEIRYGLSTLGTR